MDGLLRRLRLLYCGFVSSAARGEVKGCMSVSQSVSQSLSQPETPTSLALVKVGCLEPFWTELDSDAIVDVRCRVLLTRCRG